MPKCHLHCFCAKVTVCAIFCMYLQSVIYYRLTLILYLFQNVLNIFYHDSKDCNDSIGQTDYNNQVFGTGSLYPLVTNKEAL